MSHHSARAQWNTANARLANKPFDDLFTYDKPKQEQTTVTEETLIQTIAHNYGCIAEVVRRACQMADYPADLLESRRAEYVEQVHELTPNDLANLDYGTFDLGTHTVISGGDVLELGKQEATETDIPF
jgi:hypothetical protein